jgi:hypothetical protein
MMELECVADVEKKQGRSQGVTIDASIDISIYRVPK